MFEYYINKLVITYDNELTIFINCKESHHNYLMIDFWAATNDELFLSGVKCELYIFKLYRLHSTNEKYDTKHELGKGRVLMG